MTRYVANTMRIYTIIIIGTKKERYICSTTKLNTEKRQLHKQQPPKAPLFNIDQTINKVPS